MNQRKKNKLLLILSSAVAVFGVFVAAISTAAWFQIDAQPLSSEFVTGSSDISISKVTSYKKKTTLSANGLPAVEDAVSYLDLSKIEGGTKANDNLMNADLNFDVPDDGVGYYLVAENKKHSFAYHNAYSVTKFTELADDNAHIGYTSAGVDLYTARSFRIRKYLITGNTTTSETVAITGVDKLTNAPANTAVNNNDITIGADGNYKVWLDYDAGKLGFERLGDPTEALDGTKAIGSDGGNIREIGPKKELVNYDGNTYPNRIAIVLNGLSGWDSISDVHIGITSLTDATSSGTTIDNSYYGVEGQYWAVFDGVSTTKTTLYLKFTQYSNNYYYPVSGVFDGKVTANLTGTISMSPGNVYQATVSYGGITESGGWGSNRWFNTSFAKADDLVRDVKISTNNGTSYVAMTHNSGNEWKYTFSTSTDGQKLKFKLNDSVQSSLVKKTGSAAYNRNNCSVSGDTATITYGAAYSTSVYYDIITKDVWVEQAFKLKVGSNYFPLTRQADKQFVASYYGNKGDVVAIYNCGTSETYAVDGDTYNNVKVESSVKKLQKTISSGSPLNAYFNNGKGDVLSSSTTLWMDGNKNYRVGYRYGDSGSFTYQDMGYDETTGKYLASGIALTYKSTTAKLNFQINGADINGTNAPSINKDTGTGSSNDEDWYSYNNVSGVSGSIASVTYGGTVDVYYDTSNGKIIVTPVYSIQINSGSYVQATGTGDLRTSTRTASGVSVSEGDSVGVRINNSTYTYTLAGAENDVPNNLTAGKKVLSIGRNASASVDIKVYVRTTSSGSRTVYVGGYREFEYYMTVTHSDLSTTGYSMSLHEGQMRATGVVAVRGDKLTFEKNYTALGATAENAARNNVTNDEGVTVLCDGTIDVYLKNYTTTPIVWATGFKTTFYFYNSDPGLASSQRFYAIFSGGSAGAVQMSQDGTDPRLHYYQYDAADGTSMIISTTSGGTGTASASINLATAPIDSHPYCTYTTAGTGTGKAVKWYANAPQTGSDKFYVYGGYSKAYAWNNASEEATNGTYMKFNGLHFPGSDMTAVITGSLYVVTGVNSTVYDKLIFSNGNGGQTGNLTTSGHADGIYVQASSNWANEKTDESYGNAIIHKIHGGVETTFAMSIGDNGNRSGNYFIYEHGLQAQNGDYLWVEVNNNGGTGNKKICTESAGIYTPGPNGIYYNYDDSREFVDRTGDNPRRPYLNIITTDDEGDHEGIQVNIGGTSTARFNFYITKLGKLAIVMVPDYGNGFYIMDYSSTTEGFIGATKMNTITATSATYDGFYADSTELVKKQIFVRSYMNAVDKDYKDSNIIIDSSASGKVTKSGAIITFVELGYYNLEIMGDTLTISKPGSTDFLTLNPLNLSSAGNQSAIKAQNTSIVLEVQFTTSNNNFKMSTDLLVTNGLSTYVGVAYYVTDEQPANPYTFMRDEDGSGGVTKYSLSNGATISNLNSTFRTSTGTSSKVYYAYIIIDYIYSNNLSGMTAAPSGALSFHIRTTQEA